MERRTALAYATALALSVFAIGAAITTNLRTGPAEAAGTAPLAGTSTDVPEHTVVTVRLPAPTGGLAPRPAPALAVPPAPGPATATPVLDDHGEDDHSEDDDGEDDDGEDDADRSGHGRGGDEDDETDDDDDRDD